MRVRLFAGAFVFLLLAGPASVVSADEIKPEAPAAANSALAWMKQGQLASGAIAGIGTPESIYSIVAGGQDPGSDDWKSGGGKTPLDVLEAEADSNDCEQLTRSDCNAGRAAKIAIAAVAAGRNPRELAGGDVVAGMMADTTHTGITSSNFSQAYALIALPAAGEHVPPAVISRMVAAQKQDGGWGFVPGVGSDTNSTAIAMQGLAAARPGAGIQQGSIDSALSKAVEYLLSQQNDDGGFGYDATYRASEPDSTSGVILAVRSVGDDPKAGPWVKAPGTAPVDALLRFQRSDGAFARSAGGDANGMSTAAAVPGLMERSLVCLTGLARCPGAAEALPVDPGPGPDPPGQHAPGDTARPPHVNDAMVLEPAQPSAQVQQPADAASQPSGPPSAPAVQQGFPSASNSRIVSGPEAATALTQMEASQLTSGLFPPGGGGFSSPEAMAASAVPPSPVSATAPDSQSSQVSAQPAYFAVALASSAVVFALLLGVGLPRQTCCTPGLVVGAH